MYSLSPVLVLHVLCALGFARAIQEAHLRPEQAANLFQNAMTCISETGVNPQVILELQNGNFSDDVKFKKFMFCLLRKMNLLMKDGHIKVEKSIEQYPKDVDREGIKKALEECNKETGNNPAETTFNVSKCFHAKTPVHLVL